MLNQSDELAPFAPVILRLLRRVVTYHDRADWGLLLTHRRAIEHYLGRIGLELVVNEEDGYAFITQPREDADGKAIKLPALTARVPLKRDQTILAVLLRERLDMHDQDFGAGEELILTFDEIYDLMQDFIDTHSDQRRDVKRVEGYIRQFVNMGLLREIDKKRGRYRLERVIKSRVTADILQEVKQKLIDSLTEEHES